MNDAHERMDEYFRENVNTPEPVYVPPTYETRPVRQRRFEGPVQIRT